MQCLMFVVAVLALITVTSVQVTTALKIRDILVPPTITLTNNDSIILDCDYGIENDTTGLVLKWFHNDQPIYQWIINHAPQDLGAFRGKLDLTYRATDNELTQYRAIKIKEPSLELAGVYKCMVANFNAEDSMSKRMVVITKCEEGCEVPVAHYKETGCEPVFAQPDDCCPSHYNCAKFEGRAADKCYVKGNVYNKGESIDTSITQRNCLASCICVKDQWKDITCAHIDCPEFLGGSPLLLGCYRPYDVDSCCSKEPICPPFDKVAKCEVDGKTYNEGQRWYPEGKNLECVCKPDFKGKLEAPFCLEPICGVEFVHTLDIKNKCAPVFYGSKGNCPIQWECLKEGEVVVPNEKGTTSEQKCSYGEKTLNVGDKLLLKQASYSPKIECECKIPPLITCIQKPHEQKRPGFLMTRLG